MKRRILIIVLAGLLLAACVPVTAPAPTAPVTAPASAAAPATVAPIVSTAAPAAAATVPPAAAPATTPADAGRRTAEFGGVTFTFPTGLAQGAPGKDVPAEAGGTDAPWWVPVPQHTEIDLAGYVLTGTLHTPAVLVYPAPEFAEANKEAAARMAALKQLLQTRPADLTGVATNGVPDLPFLPLYNAKQAMHTGGEYLAFPNGHGVRYLTQYNQGPAPINNQELFYTFQGLTDDGKFYVAAVLPVSHASLPAGAENMPPADREAMAGNYTQYVRDTAAALAAQAGATFKPSLADLDSLIQTLQIAASAS